MRSRQKFPLRILSPLNSSAIADLTCGSPVLLSGSVLLARESALRWMVEETQRGRTMPFDLNGMVLFHAGFTPASPGRILGSIGPTTSLRMDPWTPSLLKAGVKGMIGKGKRSPEVVEAIREAGAVYFAATGGAAAFLSRSVRSFSFRMDSTFGAEAPALLEVIDLPLIVAVDPKGNDLFEQGRRNFIKGTDQVQ
ncbi:MAG TPA: fumarate hydratase C-terminal domain-containing protein [Synergistales bacterium]|nr:fumarate hydratase C-terminal domain-containing protein [Synergistales bacterium]